jgi:formamidopyrimidine-DNA glycosylase
MSGQFHLLTVEMLSPKFTHASFMLDREETLVFRDQRHFGYMNVVPTRDVLTTREIATLAPEPFSELFSKEYIISVNRASGHAIKELLLDQTRYCGLGNIYAAEALFHARINPSTPSKNLSPRKSKDLHDSVIAVLTAAIDKGLDEGERTGRPARETAPYDFAGGWNVYGRENEPCLRCGRPIRRIKQGGRSTFYCPRCQPARGRKGGS